MLHQRTNFAVDNIRRLKEPRVISEDNHLVIVEKPAGWLVQGDQTGDPTLTEWTMEYIRKKYNKPGNVFCHPCHRLDRPVSGLVTFAKTSKALERMNKLFREDEVNKTYLAVVEGTPTKTEGKLVHWLEKDSSKNFTRTYQKSKGQAKRAELEYRLLASLGKQSLLMIHPKTGRPHQIRAQMKALGCPIKGDLKYGYPKPNRDKSIDLHAFKLTFIHPVKKQLLEVVSRPGWESFEAFIRELD